MTAPVELTTSHRYIENGLAIVGALLLAAYVIGVEVLPPLVYATKACTVAPMAPHGIPWGVVISAVVLILPKVAGRATYGRIWDGFASKLGKKVDDA